MASHAVSWPKRFVSDSVRRSALESGGGAPCSIPDRKSTRLNSSHANISYAVFCLKKKKKHTKLFSFSSRPTYSTSLDVYAFSSPLTPQTLSHFLSLPHDKLCILSSLSCR